MSSSVGSVATASTALFVPGDRPERFAKAAAAEADLVIIDLEDAVGLEAKPEARRHAVRALVDERIPAALRISKVGATTHAADIDVLTRVVSGAHSLRAVMVAGVESAGDLDEVGEILSGSGIPVLTIALIESAAGVLRAEEIAAHPSVARLAFGGIDYALDISAEPHPEVFAFARSVIVIASRVAGIVAPLDTPTVDFRDMNVVASDAATARRFGFGGKLCIHPNQVNTVREAFLPTAQEREWAVRVLEVSDGEAAQLDGVMVDLPVIARARRILDGTGHTNCENPPRARG